MYTYFFQPELFKCKLFMILIQPIFFNCCISIDSQYIKIFYSYREKVFIDRFHFIDLRWCNFFFNWATWEVLKNSHLIHFFNMSQPGKYVQS